MIVTLEQIALIGPTYLSRTVKRIGMTLVLHFLIRAEKFGNKYRTIYVNSEGRNTDHDNSAYFEKLSFREPHGL